MAFTACEDDNDSNPVLDTFPTSFVLNTPDMAANNVYDLPYTVVNMTASQPDYGGWPASVTYAVQMSLDQQDWTELGATYPTPFISIDGSELNDLVLAKYGEKHTDLNGDPIAPEIGETVYFRSRAFLSGVEGTLGECYSNVVSIKVYAWQAPVELSLPTDFYVCGGSIGDAWSTWKKCPLIWTKEGQFYTMIYNNADGFKWGNKPNDWFGYDKIDEWDIRVDGLEVSTDNDGNIVFNKAGWYVLKVVTAIEGKKVKYTMTVSEGMACVIGNATGGWDGIWMDEPASKDEPWTYTDWSDSGELRAYIVVPGVDWWMTEFTLLDGSLVWRDADHNCQDNWKKDVGEEYSVTVGPGKKLSVNFDRNTGSVEDI